MTALDEREYIATQRPDLTLRRFMREDARAIFALIDGSREHLSQHGEDTAIKYPTIESVIESIEHPTNLQRLRLGIWHEKTLVGSINLQPLIPPDLSCAQIGYYLGAQHTGKGYARSALEAVTDYAFTHGCQEVIAFVVPANRPSIAVLRKAGYEEKGDFFSWKIFSRCKP